jgi:hypothetical protein
MVDNPDPSMQRDFCTTLGIAVITWNAVEMQMRRLLAQLSNPSNRVAALIAHLGNVALADALKAVAHEWPEDLQKHLNHCAALFDRERAYRNHYVHSPINLIRGKPAVSTKAITSKGGALRIHEGEVDILDITSLLVRLNDLHRYIQALGQVVVNEPSATPLASIEKPPLPDELKLPRQHLVARKPASPA